MKTSRSDVLGRFRGGVGTGPGQTWKTSTENEGHTDAMNVELAVDNPYWDAVRHVVAPDRWGRSPADLTVDGFPVDAATRLFYRGDFTSKYSWSIPDPETLAFVAEYAGGRLVDPLAGSGYWASLLAQLGMDVVAYDLNPPGGGANHWHKAKAEYVTVLPGDAVETVTRHPDRTLLLSWPPYDSPTGVDTLRAYRGNRVIYVGEGVGGCCGDVDLFNDLDTNWTEIAERRPVQWSGIHDYVTVYDREDS